MMAMQSLQNKPADSVTALRAVQDAERLRLAISGAGIVSFDWTMAGDTIVWDGNLSLLPNPFSTDKVQRGRTLLGFAGADAREKLVQLIEMRGSEPVFFDVDLEVACAMGSMWFNMIGTRMPGPAGTTERLAGVMREVSERRRESQRLRYLATRDELTGQLNRNALRTELSEAIRKAKTEERS